MKRAGPTGNLGAAVRASVAKAASSCCGDSQMCAQNAEGVLLWVIGATPMPSWLLRASRSCAICTQLIAEREAQLQICTCNACRPLSRPPWPQIWCSAAKRKVLDLLELPPSDMGLLTSDPAEAGKSGLSLELSFHATK